MTIALPVWAERHRKITLRHKGDRVFTVGTVWGVNERDGHVDM